MNFCILKESYGNKLLIAPKIVKKIISDGNKVFYTKSSLKDSGYKESEYKRAGATLCPNIKDMIEKVDVVLSYKIPPIEILDIMKKGTILVSQANIIKNKKKASIIAKKDIRLVDFNFFKNKKIDFNKILSDFQYEILKTYIHYFFLNIIAKNSGNLSILKKYNLNKKINIVIFNDNYFTSLLIKFFSNHNISVFCDLTKMDENHNDSIEYYDYNDEISLLDNLKNADLVISSPYYGYKPSNIFINNRNFKNLKENCLLMDLNMNNGGSFSHSKETSIKSPFFLKDKIFLFCPVDLFEGLGRYYSDYIGFYIYHILHRLYNEKITINDDFVLICDEEIKENVDFVDKNKNMFLVKEPFDLMNITVTKDISSGLSKINRQLENLFDSAD